MKVKLKQIKPELETKNINIDKIKSIIKNQDQIKNS